MLVLIQFHQNRVFRKAAFTVRDNEDAFRIDGEKINRAACRERKIGFERCQIDRFSLLDVQTAQLPFVKTRIELFFHKKAFPDTSRTGRAFEADIVESITEEAMLV